MDRFTKIFLGVIFSFVVVILLVVLIATRPSKGEKEYDVSSMKIVTVQEIKEMFDDKGTYVLMFGEKTCEVCQKLLPKMVEAQKELNYTTRYIDILSIDFETNSWKAVEKLLDMKSTQTISEDGSGDTETNTYGYFLSNYAFAPTVVIIKDGKQVGGFIGGVAEEDLIPWLKVKIK